MRVLSGISVGLLVAVLGARVVAQAPVYGASSPQEVVANLQKVTKAGDFAGALPFISPTGRQVLATSIIQPLLMWVQMFNPDDPMPGSPKLPKAQLDAKRKNYKAVVDGITQTLKPHGLDSIVGKPPMSPATQQAMDAAFPKTDTVVLLTSLVATMKKLGPLMEMPPDAVPSLPVMGPVSGYKITGDKATAKEGKDPIDFERVNGRWYLTPPAGK